MEKSNLNIMTRMLEAIEMGNSYGAAYKTVAVTAVDSDGENWVDLYVQAPDGVPRKLLYITLDQGGSWTGDCTWRVVDDLGNKFYPFADDQAYGALEHTFSPAPCIPSQRGFKVQFKSNSGDDGEGETLAITSLKYAEF